MEHAPPSQVQTVGERTAANIRAELARRKLSGRDLARGCDWPTTTTWSRLNGRTPLNVDELAAVSDFLRIPVAELMGVGASSPPSVAAV